MQDQGKRIAINGKSNSRALYYIKVSKYNTVDYFGPKMCQFKWKEWVCDIKINMAFAIAYYLGWKVKRALKL